MAAASQAPGGRVSASTAMESNKEESWENAILVVAGGPTTLTARSLFFRMDSVAVYVPALPWSWPYGRRSLDWATVKMSEKKSDHQRE